MKKVHLKSAIPIYIAAAVWLIVGLILPKVVLKLPGLIAVTAVSVAAYFGGSKLFPGRTIVVEEQVSTGNADLDREIREGRARIEKLCEANAAIPDPKVTRDLDRMTKSGEQIFTVLARDPRKAGMVRRFMNYYLPTAEKMMDQYRQMMDAPVKGENIKSAMERVESSLGVMAEAFEKCADNLYKDDDMDIDAEISALRTLLAGDNLVGNAVSDIRNARPKATEAKPEEPGIKLTLGGH